MGLLGLIPSTSRTKRKASRIRKGLIYKKMVNGLLRGSILGSDAGLYGLTNKMVQLRWLYNLQQGHMARHPSTQTGLVKRMLLLLEVI